MNSILGINVDMSAEAELVDAGRFHSEDTGRKIELSVLFFGLEIQFRIRETGAFRR